jgi:hypothetical protein
MIRIIAMAIYYKTNSQIKLEAARRARSVRRVILAAVFIVLSSSLVSSVVGAVQTVQGAL